MNRLYYFVFYCPVQIDQQLTSSTSHIMNLLQWHFALNSSKWRLDLQFGMHTVKLSTIFVEF